MLKVIVVRLILHKRIGRYIHLVAPRLHSFLRFSCIFIPFLTKDNIARIVCKSHPLQLDYSVNDPKKEIVMTDKKCCWNVRKSNAAYKFQ